MSRAAGNVKDRFDEKYIPEPNSGCWLWMASCRPDGYGQFAQDATKGPSNKIELAHRVSWRLFCGEIPKGMLVLHKCDVRCCVNPEHLFLGTHLDNMQDAVRKGRTATGINGKHPHKLSADQVIGIKTSEYGPAHLAKVYDVSPTHVCAIQKGRRRSNVEVQ